MPKPRADLQVVAYRIDAAIRVGRAEALPIYPLINGKSDLDRWPSLLLHLGSLRIRLPPLYLDSKARYEAKYEKPWYNRVTIGPCVFNSRYIAVTRRSPDYEWLLNVTREERRAVQVIETAYGLRRRIYEVVEDLSHGLRQPIHVESVYEEEREKLTLRRYQLREILRQQAAGLIMITNQEKELADLTSVQIYLRLQEIDRILVDRRSREESLQSYARQSNLHLFFLAQSLSNFVGNISRTGLVNRQAVESYLRSFLAEVVLFTSREVRPHRTYAKSCLERVLAAVGSISAGEACRLLARAVEHLTRAAVVLSRWADSLPEEETRMARLRWVRSPAPKQLL